MWFQTNIPEIKHVGSTKLTTPFELMRGSQAQFTCSQKRLLKEVKNRRKPYVIV